MHPLTEQEQHDAQVHQAAAEDSWIGPIGHGPVTQDATPWYQQALNWGGRQLDRAEQGVERAQAWVDDHATRARSYVNDQIHAGEDTVGFYSHRAADSINNPVLRGAANVVANDVTLATQAAGTLPIVATEALTGAAQAVNHPVTSLGASPLIPGRRGAENTVRMVNGMVAPVRQAMAEGRPGEAVERVGIDLATLRGGGEGGAIETEAAAARRGPRPAPRPAAPMDTLPRNHVGQMPAINPAELGNGPPPGFQRTAVGGGLPPGTSVELPTRMPNGPRPGPVPPSAAEIEAYQAQHPLQPLGGGGRPAAPPVGALDRTVQAPGPPVGALDRTVQAPQVLPHAGPYHAPPPI
jgi:hypothetical protein